MPVLSLFHVQGGQLKQGFSCTACALHQNADLRTNCMQSVGSSKPKFLFVGFAPGREDDTIGKPMTGANGRLFHDLLRDAGYFREEVHFTNCVKCAPHDINPTKTHWKSCKQHFLAELARLDPEVVVAVGAKAIEWITGHTGVSKLSRKGLPIEDGDGRIAFPLRQPAALFHKEGAERFQLRMQMVDELRWLRSEQQAGRVGRKVNLQADYFTCRTPEDVEALFEELDAQDDFAFDLETDGLYPDPGKEILAIGFSWGDRMGRALPLHARGVTSLKWWDDEYLNSYILPKLIDLLKRKKMFGHNAIQFDQKWVRKRLGIQNLNIDYDVMLNHYILNEERGTHDLEQLSLLNTDMPPWKREFNPEDTEQLCLYLCKDVDATFRLRNAFLPQLNERQQWLMNQILIPLAKEFFEIEYRGVQLDENQLQSTSQFLQKAIDHEVSVLRSDKFVRLYEIAENTQLNHDSPEQLRVLFEKYLKWPMVKKTGTGAYSTDKEVLDHYKEEPVAGSILRIRQVSTLQKTFCSQLMREVRNGRLHTSYKVHGTVTGRPASADPNLNNIPREDTTDKVFGKGSGNHIKRAFVAAPGYCLLEADYSQAELRVLASMSFDKELLGIYQRGEDAHTATAAKVYKIPLLRVSRAQRTAAKQTNFGIVYGMTIEGLIKKFEAAGSNANEANRFLSLHKQTFPDVWKYMDEQEDQIRAHGFQETYFGRRRRYVEIDDAAIRQAYNFPIQSVASDLTVLALIRIAQALRHLNLDAHIVLTVYDSIEIECKLEIMWQVAALVKHIMSSIHFDWMLVPMAVDLKAGFNWGDMKEIDVATQTIGH